MSFRVAAIGPRREPVVVAEGTIDNGTASQLQVFLSGNPALKHRPTIVFASPGGTVLGATALGRYLGRIGATSMVGMVGDPVGENGSGIAPGICVGTCVYAFLGGAHRILPSRSVLGIKRMRYEGQGDGGAIYGQVVSSLRAYIRSVGVSPGFADYCEQLPDETLHVLTPAEVVQWHLATIH